MKQPKDLQGYLEAWTRDDPGRESIAATLLALAGACREISALVGRGPLAGPLGAPTGRQSGVDPQKEVDVRANDLLLSALAMAPVAAFASEELEHPAALVSDAPLVVAADPIDGSSNIDANTSVGTIFTVLPALPGRAGEDSFLQPGTRQKAAGFTVYGPFTSMALTVGDGTHLFVLDRETGRFMLTQTSATIPPSTREFAVNISNYRHWEVALRIYADDLLRGTIGPRGKDFNMRWTASPVADLYRILTRGGIFLYPGDLRDGYAMGRLRLVYEANPLAWIVEQAGGAATTGQSRILEEVPSALHQRTPIVAGSRSEVEYVVRLGREPMGVAEHSPLFTKRGLFRT